MILTDVNDEAPTFARSGYRAEVAESAQRHLPIAFLGSEAPRVRDYDQVPSRAGRQGRESS